MTVTYRAISFSPSPNKTPPSLPYHFGSKRKTALEEKINTELPADIGYDSSYSTLVIDDDLNMGDMSAGNCSLNNHTHSLNSIVITLMMIQVVDVFFQTVTLSPNVNI